jgi:histidine triad (HIT) family protein
MSRALFRLARRLGGARFFRYLIGWSFAHMSFLIPVDRLHETETLVAFHHPRPSYPVHVLIVPKRARGKLTDVTAADVDFMADLFAAVRLLVDKLALEGPGYRLICNGGPYQDVPQLHFHLVSGEMG